MNIVKSLAHARVVNIKKKLRNVKSIRRRICATNKKRSKEHATTKRQLLLQLELGELPGEYKIATDDSA